MDLNRLTQKSQEALHDAQTKTLRFGHTEVDGEPDPPPREQAVARLQEGEREKLLRIDEVLHERVVGQDEAGPAGRRRDHPGAIRDQGSASADRLVHFPRPHGCREDRARQGSCGRPVRHRREHDPDRHALIPGAPHREPAGRCPTRVRRL